jgi:ribosomal protein S18 acetylase RimI-like enzyme
MNILKFEVRGVCMEITIVKGNMDYINDCEDALVNSELGIRYFSEKGSARKALEEGFAKEEIYIAIDNSHNCRGFMWFILGGMFHSFPYLHIVAVKQESRKHGIGKKLLKFFEDICFKDHTKLFLVVADFNPDAKVLYERIGYIEVGAIPNLYREGITEYLMMKVREEKR